MKQKNDLNVASERSARAKDTHHEQENALSRRSDSGTSQGGRQSQCCSSAKQ